MKKGFLFFLLTVMLLGLVYTYGENIVMTIAGETIYKPALKVETREKLVSATFNIQRIDQGEIEAIDTMLSLLRETNSTATFFLTRELIIDQENLMKKISLAGCEVGYLASVKDLEQLTLDELREEYDGISEIILKNTGNMLKTIRPLDSYNDAMIYMAHELGIKTFYWDVDAKDYRNISTNDIVQRVKAEVSAGSVILFSIEGTYTPSALKHLIKEYKEQDYNFVNIRDLF